MMKTRSGGVFFLPKTGVLRLTEVVGGHKNPLHGLSSGQVWRVGSPKSVALNSRGFVDNDG